jgi:hypothetical protein
VDDFGCGTGVCYKLEGQAIDRAYGTQDVRLHETLLAEYMVAIRDDGLDESDTTDGAYQVLVHGTLIFEEAQVHGIGRGCGVGGEGSEA